jgi:hypothetical protein
VMAGPGPCGSMRRRTVSRGRDTIISIPSHHVKLPLPFFTMGPHACLVFPPSASISWHVGLLTYGQRVGFTDLFFKPIGGDWDSCARKLE